MTWWMALRRLVLYQDLLNFWRRVMVFQLRSQICAVRGVRLDTALWLGIESISLSYGREHCGDAYYGNGALLIVQSFWMGTGKK
jgi:hypothetical protein